MLLGLFCVVLTVVLYRFVGQRRVTQHKYSRAGKTYRAPSEDNPPTQFEEDDGRPVRGSKVEEREKLIRACGLFDNCQDSEVHDLAKSSQIRAFNHGDVMIVQGNIGQCMYIIKEGRARVTINRPGADLPPHECYQVDVKMPGVHFGEVALMCDTPRTAHVLAEGKVECLVISRPGFLSAMPHDALSK